MKLIIIAIVGISRSICAVASAEHLVSVESLLSVPPEEAAQAAANAGDYRAIMVPGCVGLAHGFSFQWWHGKKHPVGQCRDLIGEDADKKLKQLGTYAEKYNEKIQELAE